MTLARCPWYIAGPLLGVLIVALRASVNRPLGALGGYIDLAEHFKRPRELGFTAFRLFGILLGGTVFAFTTGAIEWTFVYGPAEPVQPIIGRLRIRDPHLVEHTGALGL
jgi:hypothetical protein